MAFNAKCGCCRCDLTRRGDEETQNLICWLLVVVRVVAVLLYQGCLCYMNKAIVIKAFGWRDVAVRREEERKEKRARKRKRKMGIRLDASGPAEEGGAGSQFKRKSEKRKATRATGATDRLTNSDNERESRNEWTNWKGSALRARPGRCTPRDPKSTKKHQKAPQAPACFLACFVC